VAVVVNQETEKGSKVASQLQHTQANGGHEKAFVFVCSSAFRRLSPDRLKAELRTGGMAIRLTGKPPRVVELGLFVRMAWR